MKLHYIEEADEQEKEALRVKVERVRVDEERIGFEGFEQMKKELVLKWKGFEFKCLKRMKELGLKRKGLY